MEDTAFLESNFALVAQKVTETLKNAALLRTLKDIVAELNQEYNCNVAEQDKNFKTLVYEVATKFPKEAIKHRLFFLKYVAADKVVKERFDLYLQYFKTHRNDPEINIDEFENECGIGVNFSKEDTIREVKKFLDTYDDFQKNGWKFNRGKALAQLKTLLKFSNGNDRIQALDDEIVARLGPKPDDKDLKKEKQSKLPPSNASSDSKPAASVDANNNNAGNNNDNVEDTFYDTLPDSVQFHDPKDNVQLRPELLAAHLAYTGGKVRTRFPPEPNGYLHIGHAKSMNLNFGYAKKKGGICFLRFDDTNPDKEKQEYIDSIIRTVEWLGHHPHQITYSSDYFDTLYDLAVKLITIDKAYVCHETSAEMRENRKNKVESKWRNRPIEESLKLFEDMKKGKIEEGKATLRMKGDMQSNNPNMRDLVAYRIKFKPHPHSGDKWCIYPSYDYTHCLIDSLENITHSLCTTEFDSRRESYNWLVQALDMYLPPQIEFSRLNLTYHVMSKRKLTILVENGYVNGWDDPRLPTLEGLRRRGYTPRSINFFCNKIGITRNANLIHLELLEECLREDLNTKATRYMAVLNPIKVTLVNFGGEDKHLVVPNIPKNDAAGSHSITMSSVIYIDRDDFRELSSKNYYRLTPDQNVGLKYFGEGNIKLKEIIKNENGDVVELLAEIVPKEKVKAHVTWVSSPSSSPEPKKIEVRLYDRLFTKAEVNDYLAELNSASLVTVMGYADSALGCTSDDHVQFERLGYFYRDPSSTSDHPIWNRTTTLNEDKSKLLVL